jgi:hypothetical protein
VIAVAWLLALPQLATTPVVHRMIERHERLGVDPSAKFYSELPAMPRINEQVRRQRRAHEQAFWRPSATIDR